MEKKISYNEFRKLSREEKNEAFQFLDGHDKFVARLADPPEATVINHRELTDEEKEQARMWEEDLRKKLASKTQNE